MHRSGTSLLGGLLQRLGLALPGEAIAADEHNPEGYFEWDQVVALQERLLIDLERWWPSPEGTLALPDHWLNHPATIAARRELRELLIPELDRHQHPWAIKDPRCSRLLPLWLDLAAELGISLQLLLAVRDPAEVTASLLHRDGPLTGMDANRAQQLWWRHNLEVVHAARTAGLPLEVVDFGHWFDQPEVQLEHLLKACPGLDPTLEQRQQALDLIHPEHRRSIAVADQIPIRPELRRLHQRLLRTRFPRRWPSAEPPAGLLRHARSQGGSSDVLANPTRWSEWLEHHRFYPAPRHPETPSLANLLRLSSCGAAWFDLYPHLLTQRLPIGDWGQFTLSHGESHDHQLVLHRSAAALHTDSEAIERICLNLELPSPDRAEHWLNHLRDQQLIWDPDPVRVRLLRSLGLPAWWLDVELPVNDWLQSSFPGSPQGWAALLGLPAPSGESVMVLGAGGKTWDQACAEESAQMPDPFRLAIDYLPGWADLIVDTPELGLARASWLQAAARSSQRLFVAGVSAVPSEYSLLADLMAVPMRLTECATPELVRTFHAGQPRLAAAEDRLSPSHEILFHWSTGEKARASVLISLFNYGDRVLDALASVAAQTASQLELIVVDDCSSDRGRESVAAWMEERQSLGDAPLVRMLLVRHSQNSGLAVARNTGFELAKAPWCMVLDADNALCPQALELCLKQAEVGSDDLAVVHPLLAVEAEPGRPDDERSLVCGLSWQRAQFMEGNVIDAMALIRHQAWREIGGYTHIEGGWEDYDFWCKLIDSGFHGVEVPRVLATYRSHSDSMSFHRTQHNQGPLSRTLQGRHPWLKLPLADS